MTQLLQTLDDISESEIPQRITVPNLFFEFSNVYEEFGSVKKFAREAYQSASELCQSIRNYFRKEEIK